MFWRPSRYFYIVPVGVMQSICSQPLWKWLFWTVLWVFCAGKVCRLRCAPLHLALAVCRTRGDHLTVFIRDVCWYISTAAQNFCSSAAGYKATFVYLSLESRPQTASGLIFISFHLHQAAAATVNSCTTVLARCSECVVAENGWWSGNRHWLLAPLEHYATGDLCNGGVCWAHCRLSCNHLCKPQNRLWLSLAARTQTTAPLWGLTSGKRGSAALGWGWKRSSQA